MLDPFYIVNYCIKSVKTSWTYSRISSKYIYNSFLVSPQKKIGLFLEMSDTRKKFAVHKISRLKKIWSTGWFCEKKNTQLLEGREPFL